MTAIKKPQTESPAQTSRQQPSTGYTGTIAIILGLVIIASIGGYMLLKNKDAAKGFLAGNNAATEANSASSSQAEQSSKPETLLTREAIDLFLTTLDQATRQKDIDGILRLITPDASITIHMKHGTQQQQAALTREEYRKTLAMEFAFPSANDFARANTTVTLAPDKRSAKVSFKSTETLRQSHRDLILEGEQTLVIGVRHDKPIITSLEQVVPGDST
jgi:hypothetical protein